MSFREFNSRYLEPGSMWVMIFGIVALCQPWNFFLHRYGVTIIIIGLVTFMIASHVGPAKAASDDAFDVSDKREGRS
jgi:hypothetical protein